MNCTLLLQPSVLYHYTFHLSPLFFTLISTQPFTFREAHSILKYRQVAEASGLALPKQSYDLIIDIDLDGLRADLTGANLYGYKESMYSEGTCTWFNAFLLPP